MSLVLSFSIYLSDDFTLVVISLSLYASINYIIPQRRFISLTTHPCALLSSQ